MADAVTMDSQVDELRRELEGLRAERAELTEANRRLRSEIDAYRSRSADSNTREQMFRALVESGPDNVAWHDCEGRYRYISPQLERTLGLSRDEVIGKTPGELFPGDQAVAGYQQLLLRVCLSGEGLEHEAVLHDPRHGSVYHNIRMTVARDAEGRIIGVVAVGRDVTEQRKAELLLHEQQEALRTVLDNSPDLIIRYDLDARRIYMNPAMQAVFGVPVELTMGGLPTDAVSPLNDPEGYLAIIRRTIASGREQWAPFSYTKGGVIYWVDMRFAPEFGPDGALASVLAVGRDITERKRSEEALAAREREFRTLADHIPLNIVRYDRAGRKIYVNSSFVRRVGGDADDLIGLTPRQTPGVEGRWQADEYAERLQQVLESGEPQEIVLSGFGSGQEIHHVCFVAERDEQGEIVGALAVGNDITRQKRAEEELIGHRERLEELVAERTEALRESRVYLQSLIDNLPLEFWAMDSDLRYTMQNPGSVENYGCVVGKRLDELGLPQELAEAWEATDRKVLGGAVIHGEYAREVDGELRHYESLIAPMKVENEVRGIVGLGIDISERKAMENSLRESRTMLAEAQRIAYIGSWELNLLDDALVWSDEVYRIFEIEPGEFDSVAEAFKHRIHPEDREKVNLAYDTSLQKHAPYRVEHRLLFDDGRIKYVHERCETLYDDAGRPLRSIGTVHDITDIKQAEHQLKRSLVFTDQLINAIPDPVFVKDRQHRWLRLNDAFCAMVGYPREMMVGKSDYDFFPAEQAAVFWEKDELVFASGEESINEEDFTDAAGVTHSIQTKKAVITDADGNQILVGVIRDITERKEAELQLKQALEFSEGVINAIPDLLFKMDRDGRYLNIWTHRPELLATQQELLLGRRVDEVLSPEAAATVIEMLREAEANELAFGRIIRIDLPGQSGAHWFELSASRLPDGEGGGSVSWCCRAMSPIVVRPRSRCSI